MMLAIGFLFLTQYCVRIADGAGLDAGGACSRPARSGRAATAPCDLAKQHYCPTPGTAYPWKAIRRFVRENQGLMRRMYGEERHISVIKAELENFIEYEDKDEIRKIPDFNEDLIKTKMMYTKKNQGRAIKSKPHFRPIQNYDKYKKVDNETIKVKPLVTVNNSVQKGVINNTENDNQKIEITNNDTLDDDNTVSYKTKLESIANIEINNLDPDVITLDAVIKQSLETNSIYPKFSATLKNSAGLEESSNKTDFDGKNTTTTENPANLTETTTDFELDDTTTEAYKDGWKPMNGETSTLPPTFLFSEHEKLKNDRVNASTNEKKEDIHQKPQENLKPAVIKLRGANACETKEEMAAPFWANSTRGEILALLNMYPFEQYIHLETCVHERRQMYCREGCRCEQQFRLHRLLAYDPRNECRGIFADWFKFPACCVCKCYDVPLEFRARSPRILRPQYGEDIRRAIYEDVARDWHAMALEDDDDLYR